MEPERLTLKDGRSVLIRRAKAGDGELMREYLCVLGASTPYILTFPGDLRTASVYEENVEKALRGEFYSLCAIDPEDGSIIACSSFHFGNRVKTAHVASLGTGVIPKWQGVGLGSWMLGRAIRDMKEDPKIQRLELAVMKGNDHAQRMYERAGFLVEGCKVRSNRQPDGSYSDEILMGLWIGD